LQLFTVGGKRQFDSKMLIKFAILVYFAAQASAQNTELQRFIVGVAHYTFPDLNTAVDRCHGTIISRHIVLTTASCVTPILSSQRIAVRNEIAGHCELRNGKL
jgi:hypothetical protein